MAVFSGNGSNTAPSFTFSSDTDTGMYRRADNEIAFTCNGNVNQVFTGLGRTLLGEDNTARSTYQYVNNAAASFTPRLQISSTDWAKASLGLFNWQSGTEVHPTITFSKSLGGLNDFTALTSGADIGSIGFAGADGTDFGLAAVIEAEADGAFTATSHPGSIGFFTTAASSTTPTRRVTIDSEGRVGIGQEASSDAVLQVQAASGFEMAHLSEGAIKVRTAGGIGALNVQGLASSPVAGPTVIDTGITINQGAFGGTMMVFASRNTGTGTNTDSAVYLLQFYQDGNNAPAVTFLHGDLDFVTFGTSGSNTLTVNGNAGNWMIGAVSTIQDL